MKYIGYLKLKSKLRKNDPIRKGLLLIPFVLILVLFTFNTLMNSQEQRFKEKKYDLREEEERQWQNEFKTNSFDDIPNTKQQIIERTEENLNTLKLLRSSNYSEQLKIENKEFNGFEQAAPYLYGPEENLSVYYGFFPHMYIDGKKIINERLIQLNLEPDSVRYGTNTATFLVSVSLYLTGVFGIIYFLLLFSFQRLKERETKKYQWLAVQPINRKHLFFLDYAEFMIQSIVYYLSLLVFSFLLSLLLGKSSQWNYPLITYTNKLTGYDIIQVWQYLLIVSLLFFLNLSLSYFVVQLLVSFLKKSFTSIFLSLFLLGGMFLGVSTTYPNSLNQFFAWQPLLYYSPSSILIGTDDRPITEIQESYGLSDDATDTYTGYSFVFYPENINYYSGNNRLKTTNNPEIHYIKGVISLIITNTLLFIISINLFVKRMCD